MIKYTARIIPWITLCIVLSACGAQAQGSGGQDYKETKSMVIDILKTEEAQKAIEEAQKKKNGDQHQIIQMLSTPQGQQIQMAVKDTLTDPKYSQQLKTLMTDPKFAGDFAKAIQQEDKQLHKELLKDPEYQGLMLEVMKSSDFEKMMIDILKSKEYRKQSMTILQDSLKNPIFRSEMVDLMKKAMEEESKPKQEGGSSGGGSSGGGGGSQ